MKSEAIFCKVHTEMWGEEVTDKRQIVHHTMSRHDLNELCENYFEERLKHCSLKHFYLGKKITYAKKGFITGLLIGFGFGIYLTLIFLNYVS